MKVCEAILLHCTLHCTIQLPISISKYLFNTMCLQVYWVLYRMYWRLEVVNLIWASVLSDEEGSFKWHQRNQKQTQSNTKLATKISLLHIYFSKRCASFVKSKVLLNLSILLLQSSPSRCLTSKPMFLL